MKALTLILIINLLTSDIHSQQNYYPPGSSLLVTQDTVPVFSSIWNQNAVIDSLYLGEKVGFVTEWISRNNGTPNEIYIEVYFVRDNELRKGYVIEDPFSSEYNGKNDKIYFFKWETFDKISLRGTKSCYEIHKRKKKKLFSLEDFYYENQINFLVIDSSKHKFSDVNNVFYVELTSEGCCTSHTHFSIFETKNNKYIESVSTSYISCDGYTPSEEIFLENEGNTLQAIKSYYDDTGKVIANLVQESYLWNGHEFIFAPDIRYPVEHIDHKLSRLYNHLK